MTDVLMPLMIEVQKLPNIQSLISSVAEEFLLMYGDCVIGEFSLSISDHSVTLGVMMNCDSVEQASSARNDMLSLLRSAGLTIISG